MSTAVRWIDVGPATAATETAPLSAEVGDYAIIVLRCGEQVFAIEDRCTHDGEPLAGAEVEDCQVVCPRHGARFCVRTGEALTPPAYEPVRTFSAKIEGGRILIQEPA
jgi:3-phenylpropionate/trans-cinnamate dioxygenase ferredoxin component